MTATDEVTSSTETIVVAGSVPSEPVADADPAVIAAGLAVYRAQYCGVCHTLDAAETRGTFGPPHNGMGTIAAQHLQDGSYHGPATTPAEYIHESIVDPQAYITPGYAATSHRMPSYAHLDAQSLDALVAFLLAQ
jgi:nitric oxide reductase subunit C